VEPEVLSDVRFIDGPPRRARLDGTFRWFLSADQVRPKSRYSIALYETSADVPNTSRGHTRVPELSTADLGVASIATKLEVVLLPINTYEGYVSTLPAAFDVLADALSDLHPAGSVNVSLYESTIITSGVRDDWLAATCAQRSLESRADGVLFVGVANLNGLAGTMQPDIWDVANTCAATAVGAFVTPDSLDVARVVRPVWALLGADVSGCPTIDYQGYAVHRSQVRAVGALTSVTCAAPAGWATSSQWGELQEILASGAN
jgi:hypothetical protein